MGLRSLLTVRLLSVLITTVSGIWITRRLGPEGRGFYSSLLGFSAICSQIMQLGLPAAHAYFVTKNNRFLARLLANLKVFLPFIGSVLLVIWSAKCMSLGATSQTAAFCLLGFAFSLFSVTQSVLSGLLLGVPEGVNRVALLELGSRLLVTCLYGVLLATHWVRPISCFAVAALVSLCASLASFWALPRYGREPRAFSPRLARYTLHYGAKSLATSACAALANNLDLLIVDSLRGHAEAGQYAVATTLIQLALFPFQTLYQREFFRIGQLKTQPQRNRAFFLSLPRLTVVVIACAIGLQFCAAVLTGLFGRQFGQAANLLPLMTAGYICQILLEWNGLLVNASNPTWASLWPSILGTATSGASNMILTRRWGLPGTAWSYDLSRLVWLLLGILYSVYFVKVIAPRRVKPAGATQGESSSTPET